MLHLRWVWMSWPAVFVFFYGLSFELIFLYFSLDMSSFRKQLAPPPVRRSWTGSFRPFVPTLASASATPLAPQPQQANDSTVGPLTRREKRKQAAEFEPTNPIPINSESLIAASRGMARQAQAEQVVLERRTKIVASQLGVQEGYTLDPEVAKVIKRLLEYLQLMVTLMTTIVPPTEESRLWEKMGQEALAQATSMVLMVSILVHLNLHQVITKRLLNCLLFFSFVSAL